MGNSGRNTLRGYALFDTDLGVMKDFPLWRESKQLEFRVELFDMFNKTNFQCPDSNLGDSGLGQITSAFPARIIQVALKFIF
jgi:hypothetical protein